METPLGGDWCTLAHIHIQWKTLQWIAVLMGMLMTTTVSLAESMYHWEPYHTSTLNGEGWALELLLGHPEHIWCELGVRLHVFKALISWLWAKGQGNSRRVSLEEQLAIFLYASVTGMTI
jgi:hypothetical protein